MIIGGFALIGHGVEIGEGAVVAAGAVIGRDVQVRRLLQILERRQKNHPLLVGDPGVGKSALLAPPAEKSVKRRAWGSS